jgi:hypothetical protein
LYCHPDTTKNPPRIAAVVIPVNYSPARIDPLPSQKVARLR